MEFSSSLQPQRTKIDQLYNQMEELQTRNQQSCAKVDHDLIRNQQAYAKFGQDLIRNQRMISDLHKGIISDTCDKVISSTVQNSSLKNPYVLNQNLHTQISGPLVPPLKFNAMKLKKDFSASCCQHQSESLSVLDIPEDSIYRKLLSCIPIIGATVTILNERSLKAKIIENTNVDEIAKLIRVKNHYKIASIVRSVFNIALVVAGVAFYSLSLPFGIGVGAVQVIEMITHGHKMHNNMQTVKELQIKNSPNLRFLIA